MYLDVYTCNCVVLTGMVSGVVPLTTSTVDILRSVNSMVEAQLIWSMENIQTDQFPIVMNAIQQLRCSTSGHTSLFLVYANCKVIKCHSHNFVSLPLFSCSPAVLRPLEKNAFLRSELAIFGKRAE